MTGTMATAHAVKAPVKTSTTTDHRNAIERFFNKDKADIITMVGRIASVLSVIMYVSYIGQISNNLAGNPGTPWQPLAAFFNCVMWAIYGTFKEKRDWPIIIANVPGIFLAAATFITTFIH